MHGEGAHLTRGRCRDERGDAWPATLSVDRVSKGLRRLERRHPRGRDGDGLPGLGIATPARRAPADDELPESGDGDGLVPREGVADGGEHGAHHALGGGPGGGRLGVAIAVLANQPIRGQAILRTLILLPWAIPPVVNGLMWQWIYNSRAGALNGLLVSFGLMDGYRAWLSEPTTAVLLTVLAHVWNQLPLAVLIFLAGLQTIPGDLLSAAMVDRAGPWRRFRHIVMPWLIHPLIIVLILQTMIAFRVFELIFVLTGGGPGSSTTVIAWLTYQTAFHFLDFGEANAYAVVIALMTMLLAAFYLRSLYTRGEIRT